MQDKNETFNNIEQNTEMALLQSEKIAESVDNLEPIMEGVLVKTDEIVQEMKKSNDKPVNETRIIFEGVEMTEIRGRDGKDGEKGEKGDTGIQGLKGDKGERGEQGEKGEKGEDGTNGYDGRDGLDGYDGIDGKDGIDGRDGIDGKDGKNGTEIKPEEIKQKLESLEVGLDYEKLSNVPDIANIARVASSKTVSLSELDDVDLSGVTQTNGKYVLGGGSGTTTTINGLSGDVTLSEGNNITLNTSGSDIEINADFTQTGKYMISGGITWSGTGLTYDVSFLNYFFNGNKTANPTQVTLDASDPTDNRFDAIVVDEAGTVTAITGTPSANPEVPAIPEDQLQVTIILVAAGSTTPTIATEEIYMDDPTTNWTFSTYTTGTATGSINFAGTSSPKQGTECIEASTDARLGARFVRATSFDAFQYTMLQVWVRFTGTAVATNKSLNVRFENSAGTLVANTVNLFSYGLQRGVLNTWQLVVVPITAFGALPATVKGLKMIMAGGTVGVVRQWDIDYMILTNGSVPYANVPTIAFYKDDVGIASQSGINLIEGTGVTIDAVNNPLYNRVDYTINSSGGGGTPAGSDTQIQYNNAGAFGADSNFYRNLTSNQTGIFNTYDLGGSVFTTTGFWNLNNASLMFSKLDADPTSNVIFRSDASELKAIVSSSFSGNTNALQVSQTNIIVGNISGGNNTKITIDDVNETIAFDANGNTAYSSDIPLSIKVTVPSADLLAVVTGPTPYQLIPAPGAGKFIDVISIVCNLNFNTTAYDFNNSLAIGTNTTGSTTIGTDGGRLTISPYNMINVSATKLSVVGSAGAEKNVNTALYINTASATTVTTGDSDIDLYITYRIVTL